MLEKKIFIEKCFASDLSWLYKLDLIREKVHDGAKVPMLHKNESEAKRMLLRLKS